MNMPVSSSRNPRFGLMMARIGSSHTIKNPDGVVRQFKVRDKSRYPKAECVVVCLKCNKEFLSVEELIADHADERILKKQQEKHVYVFWSEDPIEASTSLKSEIVDGKMVASAVMKDIKKGKKEEFSPRVLGLLSTLPMDE